MMDSEDDVYLKIKSWDLAKIGLQASGSGFWSEYTDEMRDLNDAYEEQRGLDEETLYLFVFPDGNEENNLLGDMPLESRFGYIFNAKNPMLKNWQPPWHTNSGMELFN